MSLNSHISSHWRRYCVLGASILLAGCPLVPDDSRAKPPPCNSGTEKFWRCWEVLNAKLNHQFGHPVSAKAHFETGNNFQLVNVAPNSGRIINEVGAPSDDWDYFSINKPDAEQKLFLKTFFTPTGDEFCTKECYLGALKTRSHHYGAASTSVDLHQVHVVFFDFVDAKRPKPECEGRQFCLQMIVFCYDKECTMSLPDNVSVPSLINSPSPLLMHHKGVAHSGSGD